MKVLMLSTATGSVDGIRVATYEAGQQYDLTVSVGARELADAFITAGLAKMADGATAFDDDGAHGDDGQVPAHEPDIAVASTPPKAGRKPKAQ